MAILKSWDAGKRATYRIRARVTMWENAYKTLIFIMFSGHRPT